MRHVFLQSTKGVLLVLSLLLCACGDSGSGPALTEPAARQLPEVAVSEIISLNGNLTDYTIARGPAGTTVTSSNGQVTPVPANIKRLWFNDRVVGLDTEGVAGQAYRLYQAAFDRQPDLPGLGVNISAMEAGNQTLEIVASYFVISPEFISRYGQLDNTAFVTQLYANVLDRAPDPQGLAFHVGHLNSGRYNRAQTLIHFSESPENKANVSAAIANGVVFISASGARPQPQSGPQQPGPPPPPTGPPPRPQPPTGLTVTPESPAPNTQVATPGVLVHGKFSGPPGTQVRVNGQLACLANDTFFLNEFSVAEDVKALTIEAVLGQARQDATIPVGGTATPNGLLVTGSECGGVAPYEATLDLAPVDLPVGNLTKVEAFFDNDDIADYTGTELGEPIKFTYRNTGLYRARVVLHFGQGVTRESARFIYVQDINAAQQVFREVFGAFRSALSAGDAAGALQYFSVQTRKQYEKVLPQNAPQVAAQVTNWSEIEPVEIGDEIAYFSVNATEAGGAVASHMITFTRDENGFWKIDSL